jgi:hypothetical protein
VEDRCSEMLYLELSDDSDAVAGVRANDLAVLPGVRGVTWWENCALGRTDLPMRIRDASTLLVVEAESGFRSPGKPEAVSEAHCFRRTPRPSQGVLGDGPTLGLMIVWISARTPEDPRSLRDWGDFVHIRHIAAAGIPGFTQISVYENTVQSDPGYMHFYEFDNADAEGTFSKMIDYVAPRLGGLDSQLYTDWADWRAPGGRLFYCNTFSRRGEVMGDRI